MRDSVPSVRYSSICNVLHLWRISLIPTYRVYQLYDSESVPLNTPESSLRWQLILGCGINLYRKLLCLFLYRKLLCLFLYRKLLCLFLYRKLLCLFLYRKLLCLFFGMYKENLSNSKCYRSIFFSQFNPPLLDSLNGYLQLLHSLNGYLQLLDSLNGYLQLLDSLNGYLQLLHSLNGYMQMAICSSLIH